jgi:hypothetical protein
MVKVLELERVTLSPEDVVFAQSRWKVFLRAQLALVLGLSYLLVTEIFFRFKPHKEDFFHFTLFILIMVEVAMLIYFLTSLGKNRWLLRVSQEGLFVKFRPRDEYDLEQPSVLFLPFGEISSAGKWRENTQDNEWDFLELHLTPASFGRLEEVIPSEEASRAYIGTRWKIPYLFMKLKPRARLLIEWKGPKGCLAPSIDRVIELLAARGQVAI